MEGLNSFEDNPYIPPIIFGILSIFNMPFENAEDIAVVTSKYSGSPKEPGSLVLSRTAILFTVRGISEIKCFKENGLNNLTFKTPTFSSFLMRYLTVSSTVSAPLPMITIILSASGAPSYWNSLYCLPTIFANLSIASWTKSGQAL